MGREVIRRTLRLTESERGKVRAEIVGAEEAEGSDYDHISAVGKMVLAHPERFGIGHIIVVEPPVRN